MRKAIPMVLLPKSHESASTTATTVSSHNTSPEMMSIRRRHHFPETWLWLQFTDIGYSLCFFFLSALFPFFLFICVIRRIYAFLVVELITDVGDLCWHRRRRRKLDGLMGEGLTHTQKKKRKKLNRAITLQCFTVPLTTRASCWTPWRPRIVRPTCPGRLLARTRRARLMMERVQH